MKHLLRPRLIQRIRSRYITALMALGVVAIAVTMLTPAIAQASTPPAPIQTGTAVRGMPIPYSAEGCNQSVCIKVCNNSFCTGSGLYIHHVSSTGVSTSRRGCVFGEMLVRGSVREKTNITCWSNPSGYVEYFYSYYPVGYRINNGSQVCVKYVGSGAPKGEPCETVHS